MLDRRAAGIPFDFAWSASLLEVIWPADSSERGQWRAALEWARAEFQDAYERPAGMPAHVQRALGGGELAALARAGGERLVLLGAPVHS